MALKTTLERLESVQSKIEDLETKLASYQVGDVRVARSTRELSVLYAREQYLEARYRREQNRKGRVRLNLSGGT